MFTVPAPATLTAADIAWVVNEINRLVPQLPEILPLGEPDGKVYQTMMSVHSENEWHTFNRCSDILFGEDCCNSSGRLLNITRGHYGLEAVCMYLYSMLSLAASETNVANAGVYCHGTLCRSKSSVCKMSFSD